MKPLLTSLLIAICLPIVSFSQSFQVNKALSVSDQQLLSKEIYQHSILLQTIEASIDKTVELNSDEARKLVEEKLKELNNPALNEYFAKISPNDVIRIGILLHLIMGGISGLPDSYSSQLSFGAGFGAFLMYTIANFIIMPELYFMSLGAGEKYSGGGDKVTRRFAQLALSVALLYVIQAEQIKILLGISPQLHYSLSGKIKEEGEPDEDIEFDGEYAAKRIQAFLGLNAGVMLQNGLMIRLVYALGLSKIYKQSDPKLFYMGLILSMPLWSLGGTN